MIRKKYCHEIMVDQPVADALPLFTPSGEEACTLPSRVAFVDVHCAAKNATQTNVRVVYDIEALSQAGEVYIQNLSDAAFGSMIDEWADLIRDLG